MKESQPKTILSHLKNKGSITSWRAINDYKITRLAAIIHSLRKSGHNIDTVMISDGISNWAKYIYKK
jgi:hypothetical protein